MNKIGKPCSMLQVLNTAGKNNTANSAGESFGCFWKRLLDQDVEAARELATGTWGRAFLPVERTRVAEEGLQEQMGQRGLLGAGGAQGLRSDTEQEATWCRLL